MNLNDEEFFLKRKLYADAGTSFAFSILRRDKNKLKELQRYSTKTTNNINNKNFLKASKSAY